MTSIAENIRVFGYFNNFKHYTTSSYITVSFYVSDHEINTTTHDDSSSDSDSSDHDDVHSDTSDHDDVHSDTSDEDAGVGVGDYYEFKFDNSGHCCERFGAYIPDDIDLSDVRYFMLELESQGEMAIIRVKFDRSHVIEFFNEHNGYYPHDLDLYKNGEVIFRTYL